MTLRARPTPPPKTLSPRWRSALRENELRAILLFGDAGAAVLAALSAPWIWGLIDTTFSPRARVVEWQVLSVVVWVGTIWLLGGTDVAVPRFGRTSLAIVAQSAAVVTLVAFVVFFFAPFFAARGSTVFSIPLTAVLVLAWRAGYARAVRSEALDRRVALLGTDDLAMTAAAVMRTAGAMTYRPVAFLSAEEHPPATLEGIAVVRIADGLWSQVRDLGIDELVVGDIGKLPGNISNELVRCFEHGVETVPATAVYEQLTGRVLASALAADWYAELPTHTRRIYIALKYASDLALALVLAVVTSPFLLAAIAGILASSGRPVFYRQLRVGQRGEPFFVHKLRTMRPDAEAAGRPVWAAEKDPRVSPIGAWLRRTRIDELPQLWDVIRGKMSLIGPRPERPEFVQELSAALPLYRARLLLRPGLTGWAQVQYPYAGSVKSNLEKLEYDLYYLRHLGPVLDLSIVLRTAGTILGLRGR